MGLVYLNNYVHGQIGHYAVLEAVKTSLARLEKGQADAACTRWFGDSSAPFKATLKKSLDKFRSIINLQEVKVGFFDLNERAAGQNAAALPGSIASIDPSTVTTYKGRQVLLDVAFTRLPNFLPKTPGGLIDIGDWYQSKFNTLVHELSHAILATNDEDLAAPVTVDAYNGTTAYGAQRASLLATQNSAKAKTNAENWGIFIEAVGMNKAS